VIYVEATSGAVKRVGRSDAYATEFDLEAEEYVPLPKGEVHKKKEIVQVICTHMLAVAAAASESHDWRNVSHSLIPMYMYVPTGCDAARSGCSECKAAGRAGCAVDDGAAHEAEKD
jgi:hypothetical protein